MKRNIFEASSRSHRPIYHFVYQFSNLGQFNPETEPLLFKISNFHFLLEGGEEDDVRDGDDDDDEEEDKQILRDKNLEMCPPSLLCIHCNCVRVVNMHWNLKDIVSAKFGSTSLKLWKLLTIFVI